MSSNLENRSLLIFLFLATRDNLKREIQTTVTGILEFMKCSHVATNHNNYELNNTTAKKLYGGRIPTLIKNRSY